MRTPIATSAEARAAGVGRSGSGSRSRRADDRHIAAVVVEAGVGLELPVVG